jgi:hypothetical protein
MTLYAIAHRETGNPATEAIFGTMAFYENESRAQSVLQSYREEYQKFYEVKPFTLTKQS